MTNEQMVNSFKEAVEYAEPSMQKLAVAAELLDRGVDSDGKDEPLLKGIKEIVNEAVANWQEVQGELLNIRKAE